MKSLKELLSIIPPILFNLFVVAIVIYGWIGPGNILIFLSWAALIFTAAFTVTDEGGIAPPKYNKIIAAINFFTTGFLVWHAWFFTAGALLATQILIQKMYMTHTNSVKKKV